MPGPPSSGAQNANGQGVRVAELVAALSYAADLGLGQPLAHCMRQTVIALRLADLVGATQDEREATYYLGLMISAYCHADAAEQARWFGDDIAFKADAFELLGKNTAQIVAFAVRRTGSHGTGVDRFRRIVTLPRSGMRQVMDFLATHARLSSRFAEQIGLDDVAVASFRQAYEQWDGKGVPLGLRGGEITLPSRLVQLAGPVEVYARLHGVQAARAAVRRSSGADLDPAVARLFREHAPHVLNGRQRNGPRSSTPNPAWPGASTAPTWTPCSKRWPTSPTSSHRSSPGTPAEWPTWPRRQPGYGGCRTRT